MWRHKNSVYSNWVGWASISAPSYVWWLAWAIGPLSYLWPLIFKEPSSHESQGVSRDIIPDLLLPKHRSTTTSFQLHFVVKGQNSAQTPVGVGEADGWENGLLVLRIMENHATKGQEARDGKNLFGYLYNHSPRVYGPILHIFIGSFYPYNNGIGKDFQSHFTNSGSGLHSHFCLWIIFVTESYLEPTRRVTIKFTIVLR